jgi:glycosyltransferase involved in cell wall biosynthesis
MGRKTMIKKLPHIMHVIDTLSVGGAERMLVDIANATDKNKFSVSVCVTRSDHVLAQELHNYIPLRILDRKSRFDFNGFNGIRQFSQEQNVDLYHAHSRSTYSFLLAAQTLGFIEKPIILHDHFGKIIDDHVPAWFKYIGANKLTYYIGVCDELAEWGIKAGVNQDKVSVVENALDLRRFIDNPSLDLHSLLNIPINQKICIMVGNIRSEKGLDILVDAIEQIPFSQLPVFVIVGKEADITYSTLCRNKIHDVGLESNFRFIGPKESSISWIKGADLGIIPSRSESGPLVLIEYMACGLPYICSNVGGISNRVYQYLPTQFYDPNNAKQLSDKMIELLKKSKDEFIESTEMNKELANRLFDINNRIPVISNIYQTVLKNSK